MREEITIGAASAIGFPLGPRRRAAVAIVVVAITCALTVVAWRIDLGPHLTLSEVRNIFAGPASPDRDLRTVASRDQAASARSITGCNQLADDSTLFAGSGFAVELESFSRSPEDEPDGFAGFVAVHGYGSRSSAASALADVTELIDRCSAGPLGVSGCHTTRAIVRMDQSASYDRIVISCARFSATSILHVVLVGNTLTVVRPEFTVNPRQVHALTNRLHSELRCH